MSEETKKVLLDATTGIRDEYLEEAACEKPVRRRWLRAAAIAAALALMIGGILLYKPAESPEEPVLPPVRYPGLCRGRQCCGFERRRRYQ